MPTWLVTGGSGFLGRHLLDLLQAEKPADVEVVCLARTLRPADAAVRCVQADLCVAEEARQAVAEIAPGVVFHLAGQTPPAPTEQMFRSNTLGAVNLVSALRLMGRPVRLVAAGSAAELGASAWGARPIAENVRCKPSEPYGLSKWFAASAVLAAGAPVEPIVARLFNLMGPGMPATLAFGRFAAGLARPGQGMARLRVGDLDGRRDFIDVRDAARALLALALRGQGGLIYHVGTGRSRRVGEGLQRLIQLSGRAVIVESTPAPAGEKMPLDCRACIDRITRHTGWQPGVEWEQSLADLWDEARGEPALALTARRAPV